MVGLTKSSQNLSTGDKMFFLGIFSTYQNYKISLYKEISRKLEILSMTVDEFLNIGSAKVHPKTD